MLLELASCLLLELFDFGDVPLLICLLDLGLEFLSYLFLYLGEEVPQNLVHLLRVGLLVMIHFKITN